MRKCLIYTVKDDPVHLADLTFSLTYVRNNLLPFVPELDIILFHDPDGARKITNIISSRFSTNPSTTNIFLLPFPTKPPSGFENCIGVEYKNMCRFWAGEVFRHVKVKEYDYYMRLDCDSFITEPIGYDPFEMMARENKDYAFLKGGKFRDTEPYFEGINDALEEFERQYYDAAYYNGKPTIRKSVSELVEGTLYYTNFEICRIKAFSEGLYMNLFDHIERVKGIYIHRWGDHIIRYAGIHMLLGFDRVKEITDMKYAHQGFVNGVLG
jgi:hypothetical protein